jgi:hypothetical protein
MVNDRCVPCRDRCLLVANHRLDSLSVVYRWFEVVGIRPRRSSVMPLVSPRLRTSTSSANPRTSFVVKVGVCSWSTMDNESYLHARYRCRYRYFHNVLGRRRSFVSATSRSYDLVLHPLSWQKGEFRNCGMLQLRASTRCHLPQG